MLCASEDLNYDGGWPRVQVECAPKMRRKLWPKAPAEKSALGQMSKNFQVYTYNFFTTPNKSQRIILQCYYIAQKQWKPTNGPRLQESPRDFSTTTIRLKFGNRRFLIAVINMSYSKWLMLTRKNAKQYRLLCYLSFIFFGINPNDTVLLYRRYWRKTRKRLYGIPGHCPPEWKPELIYLRDCNLKWEHWCLKVCSFVSSSGI